MRWSRGTVVAVSVLGLLTSACAASDDRPDAPSDPEEQVSTSGDSWPTSMLVLGHSGVNGEGTGDDPLDNSWASGSNSDVDSVYLRILENQPDIDGHVTNLAQSGATVADVQAQAEQALQLDPEPELVVVQVVDNDMACPAEQADFDQFEDALATLLERVSDSWSGARMFVPTFYGEPASYIASLTREERREVGGEGPCAIINPDGSADRTELRRLEAVVEGYDAAIIAACEATPRCVHDGGAFERTRLRPDEIGDDLSHLSIAGNARAAAVAWRAMLEGGLLPTG